MDEQVSPMQADLYKKKKSRQELLTVWKVKNVAEREAVLYNESKNTAAGIFMEVS